MYIQVASDYWYMRFLILHMHKSITILELNQGVKFSLKVVDVIGILYLHP